MKSTIYFTTAVVTALVFQACFDDLDNTVNYGSLEAADLTLDPSSEVEGTSLQLKKLRSEIDDIAAPYILKRRSSALVFGFVDETGWATFSYGVVSLDDRSKPTSHTIFGVGSVSKPFAGMMLAAGVVANRMRLDVPVENYLPPEFEIPQKDEKKISLLHLATHTSGLPGSAYGVEWRNGFVSYLEDLIPALKRTILLSAPGESVLYSNQGAGVAGLAISYLENPEEYENLKNGKYFRLWNLDVPLKRYLSEPLGLRDTAYILDENKMTRYAFGWDKKFNGVRRPYEKSLMPGAGGLRSSASDLLKVLAAVMGLKQVDPITKAALDFSTSLQIAPEGHQMGLFWGLLNNATAGWHNGAVDGYTAHFQYDKNRKRGLVILAAKADQADDTTDPITTVPLLEQLMELNAGGTTSNADAITAKWQALASKTKQIIELDQMDSQ